MGFTLLTVSLGQELSFYVTVMLLALGWAGAGWLPGPALGQVFAKVDHFPAQSAAKQFNILSWLPALFL